MFYALGYKTKEDNLYFLFLIIFSFFFSYLFLLAGLACVVLKTIETIGTIFSFLYFSFPSFLLYSFFLYSFVPSFYLFISFLLFPSFFSFFSFLYLLSFLFSLFLSLFCVLPKAKQLEDGGGYGGEHAGGKGESKIDTVAIIALKATRVEACEEERQEEEGDADRIERGAEFAAAVIGKEAHERYHDDADGGM